MNKINVSIIASLIIVGLLVTMTVRSHVAYAGWRQDLCDAACVAGEIAVHEGCVAATCAATDGAACLPGAEEVTDAMCQAASQPAGQACEEECDAYFNTPDSTVPNIDLSGPPEDTSTSSSTTQQEDAPPPATGDTGGGDTGGSTGDTGGGDTGGSTGDTGGGDTGSSPPSIDCNVNPDSAC